MKVIVYVEGSSDKAAMRVLLAPLIEEKRLKGVLIEFFEAPPGDRKESLLTRVPKRAVNIILHDPNAIVVVMPDLYPRNKAFKHETVEELVNGINKNFAFALRDKGVNKDNRYNHRFKVFCFKYDLESLILASPESLQLRLEVSKLIPTWKIPVEDQNHERPPKRVVEELFKKYNKKYNPVADSLLILSKVAYQDVAEQCNQCFKPFVEFLKSL